ncbi:hypothetical protein PQD13_gp86 [Gordonia phage Clawz]|uniref:Uncharacterized protein n=1 Tax=Gordonia phage Clawz TaxID=2743910 RepID=A0AAE7F8W0_9CAUD|nr:hypothetical protein PQD13_gp86 [Gordonia phage Clawz]QKY79998.1 hypothetical protein SEA_CLAWZ_86 [Gordonia phage Clawz]
MRILTVDIEASRPAGQPKGRPRWWWKATRNGHIAAESGRWHGSRTRAEESVRATLKPPYELRFWLDGDLTTATYVEE